MPRNFGIKRKERSDVFVATQHALAAEGVVILAMALGAVLWMNGYAIFSQIGVWQ